MLWAVKHFNKSHTCALKDHATADCQMNNPQLTRWITLKTLSAKVTNHANPDTTQAFRGCADASSRVVYITTSAVTSDTPTA